MSGIQDEFPCGFCGGYEQEGHASDCRRGDFKARIDAMIEKTETTLGEQLNIPSDLEVKFVRDSSTKKECCTTVWVVEEGEYSDYHVVGVFSSKENAQEIAAAINASHSDKATVAEWPLDPAVAALRQGCTPFLVDMREDGTVERCDRWDISGYELAGYVRMWRRTQAPAYRGNSDKPDILQALIWATDVEHAVKIANEHRTRLIASGEWAGLQ